MKDAKLSQRAMNVADVVVGTCSRVRLALFKVQVRTVQMFLTLVFNNGAHDALDEINRHAMPVAHHPSSRSLLVDKRNQRFVTYPSKKEKIYS